MSAFADGFSSPHRSHRDAASPATPTSSPSNSSSPINPASPQPATEETTPASDDLSDQPAADSGLARIGSVTQWTLRGTELDEDISAAEAAGLAGIGLNLLKVDEYGRERTIERLAASPLSVTSLDWISNFTGFNRYSWDDEIKSATRTIRLAQRLGCRTVTVLTGPRGTQLHKRAEQLVVEALLELAPVAEDAGVHLALMPMQKCCREEWTYLHTLPHAVRLLERVGSPNVGLLFHAFHLFNQPGLPIEIQRAADWIKLVRLSDWDRGSSHENDQRFPGQGQLPLAAMIDWLTAAGYAGELEVDVWSPGVWRQDVALTLAQTRGFCQSACPSPLGEQAPAAPVPARTFEAVLSSVRT